MVRVAALVGNLKEAAYRYRVGQYLAPLSGAGVEVEPRIFPRDAGAWRALLAEAGRFDVMWLLRRGLRRREVAPVARLAPHLVFDLDDAIWGRDSNRRVAFSLRRRRRFRCAARAADLVLAGNEYLADHARRFNAAVEVLPTCVAVERYRPRLAPAARAVLELVWIGQAVTLRYLQGILGALEEFASRRPARLSVISDAFPASRRLEIRPVPWSEEREAEALAAGDVGLAPLPDDRWTRGKCGLKVLQYMAAGLPVVASPVGVQTEMIGGGERGRLAASAAEWVERLTELADAPAERERSGRAGRAFVEREYSLTRWAPHLAQTFAALAAPGEVRR